MTHTTATLTHTYTIPGIHPLLLVIQTVASYLRLTPLLAGPNHTSLPRPTTIAAPAWYALRRLLILQNIHIPPMHHIHTCRPNITITSIYNPCTHQSMSPPSNQPTLLDRTIVLLPPMVEILRTLTLAHPLPPSLQLKRLESRKNVNAQMHTS